MSCFLLISVLCAFTLRGSTRFKLQHHKMRPHSGPATFSAVTADGRSPLFVPQTVTFQLEQEIRRKTAQLSSGCVSLLALSIYTNYFNNHFCDNRTKSANISLRCLWFSFSLFLHLCSIFLTFLYC